MAASILGYHGLGDSFVPPKTWMKSKTNGRSNMYTWTSCFDGAWSYQTTINTRPMGTNRTTYGHIFTYFAKNVCLGAQMSLYGAGYIGHPRGHDPILIGRWPLCRFSVSHSHFLSVVLCWTSFITRLYTGLVISVTLVATTLF